MAAPPAALLRRLHPKFLGWLRDVGLAENLGFASYFSEEEIAGGTAARQMLGDLGLAQHELPKISEDVAALSAAVQARLRALHNNFVYRDPAELYYEHKKRARDESLSKQWIQIERRELQDQRAQPPPPPARPLYGSRLQRAQAMMGDPEARHKAEEAERRKWLRRLIDGLRAVEAPSIAKAAGSKYALELVELQVGPKRAGTLRTRVRGWSKYRDWLQLAYGLSHPRESFHVLDYLLDRRAEPASRGTLSGIMDTLRFVERAMGLELRQRMTEDEYVKTAVRGILQSTPAAVGRNRGPAHSPLVWCIVGLERVVVAEDRANYDRMLSWWLLLSSWAVLRFDDHRGIETGGVTMGDLGVDVIMSRTKTTGGDKAVAQRPGFVSWGSWIAESSWIETGWRLWQEEAPWTRDYLLVTPGPGEACQAREIKYGEYAGRMRSLLASLEVPGFGAAGAHVASYWQPHSWRAFLPSALAAIGAPAKVLGWLAAWKVQAGERYVRTQREQTRLAQITVARILRAHLQGGDPVGEKANLVSLESHLAERGMNQDDVEAVIRGVACYPGEAVDQILWPQVAEELGQAHVHKDVPPTSEPAEAIGDDAEFRPRWADGYVISVSDNRRIRRLHKLGLCYRVPGTHYTRFEECGTELPPPESYNQYCKDCWRRDRPGSSTDLQVGGESDSGTTSSSSSSSSERSG